MTEGLGQGLLFALCVRDAIGLVDGSPDAVPPLVPAVPALPESGWGTTPGAGQAEPGQAGPEQAGPGAGRVGPAGRAWWAEPTEDDARAWRGWFALLLAEQATGVPTDPLERLLAAGPTPALGSAVTALADDARRWCEARAARFADIWRQTGERRLAIVRLVTDVERELGRRAKPFTLHVVTLPVAGTWSRRARRDLVLLSAESRKDPARLWDVLAPVVREFA